MMAEGGGWRVEGMGEGPANPRSQTQMSSPSLAVALCYEQALGEAESV